MAEASQGLTEGASDDDLLKVIRLLNEAGARYLVIGGFAAILHQIPRFTRDVDILIEEDENNYTRIISALSQLADGAAKELTHEDFLNNLVIKIADEVEVDVSRRAWTVTYAEAIPNARFEIIDGIRIPYLGLADLIRSKQTYRAKDKLDIELLLENSAEAREAMRQINDLRTGPKRGCLVWFSRIFGSSDPEY